jgi:hypothetical protein
MIGPPAKEGLVVDAQAAKSGILGKNPEHFRF